MTTQVAIASDASSAPSATISASSSLNSLALSPTCRGPRRACRRAVSSSTSARVERVQPTAHLVAVDRGEVAVEHHDDVAREGRLQERPPGGGQLSRAFTANPLHPHEWAILGSNEERAGRSSRSHSPHAGSVAGDSRARPDVRLHADTTDFDPEGRTEDAALSAISSRSRGRSPRCGSALGRDASASLDVPPSGLRRASPGLVPGRLLLLGQSPHRLRAAHLMQLGEVAPFVDGVIALCCTESALSLLLAPMRRALQELFLRSHGKKERTPQVTTSTAGAAELRDPSELCLPRKSGSVIALAETPVSRSKRGSWIDIAGDHVSRVIHWRRWLT